MIRPEEGGFTQADEAYMRLALRLADEAAAEGEVPVGAVLVRDGEVAGTGRNRRETLRHALCHAEIEAIDQACPPPERLAAVRLHPICDAGTRPHVRGRDPQCPHRPGGVRGR